MKTCFEKALQIIFLIVILHLTGGYSRVDAQSPGLVRLGRIESKMINESSGLVRAADGGFWTINDSGNQPELYRLTPTGALSKTLRLKNGSNVDWEALARFSTNGVNHILVADVGDNLQRRKTVSLYIVDEPSETTESTEKLEVDATKIDFTYEDGPHNCEAVAVDPRGKCIWLVEKVYVDDRRKELPGIYRLPLPLRPPKKPLVAKRVGEFSVRNVTGMDISNDQNELIIRDYFRGYVFRRKPSESWQQVFRSTRPNQVAFPLQRQGEAVCFSTDGQSVVITSEKTQQPIWQVQLPRSESGDKSSDKEDL